MERRAGHDEDPARRPRFAVPRGRGQLLAARLARRTAGRPFDALLFPHVRTDAKGRQTEHAHDRSWLNQAMRRACAKVKVTVVTVQGLRGTWAQIANAAGEAVDAVRRGLGQESSKTTERSYIGSQVEGARVGKVTALRSPGAARPPVSGQSVEPDRH